MDLFSLFDWEYYFENAFGINIILYYIHKIISERRRKLQHFWFVRIEQTKSELSEPSITKAYLDHSLDARTCGNHFILQIEILISEVSTAMRRRTDNYNCCHGYTYKGNHNKKTIMISLLKNLQCE